MRKYIKSKQYPMKKKLIHSNNILSSHLGTIESIKRLHRKDMLYKICDNVLRQYRINFTTLEKFDFDAYNTYIYEIVEYIEKQINPVKEINIDIILGLHYMIMKKLTTTEKIKPKLIG